MQTVTLGRSISGKPGYFTGGFMALPLPLITWAGLVADPAKAQAHAACHGFTLAPTPEAAQSLLRAAASAVSETIADRQAAESFLGNARFSLRRWEHITPLPEALKAAAYAIVASSLTRPSTHGAADLWHSIEQAMQ